MQPSPATGKLYKRLDFPILILEFETTDEHR